jgi:hypothetical protein
MAKKSKLQIKLENRLAGLDVELFHALAERDRLNDLITRLNDEHNQLIDFLADEDEEGVDAGAIQTHIDNGGKFENYSNEIGRD